MKVKSKRVKDRAPLRFSFSALFILGILLVIAGFLVSSNLKIYQKRKELKAQIDSLKKEIQILEEKNQQLKAKISESEKEDYLEKEAREKLGLRKPKEEVVVVLPPEREKEEKGEEKKSSWQKFLEKTRDFFNRF